MARRNPNDPFYGLQRDLAGVASALVKLGADKAELRQASIKSGEVLANAIRVGIMPITKSGALLNSVRVSRLTTGVAVTIGNKNVPYAAPRNFGWLFVGPGHKKADTSKRIKTGRPNIKPSRFLEKGIRNSRERSIRIWIEELHNLVAKYERKTNK